MVVYLSRRFGRLGRFHSTKKTGCICSPISFGSGYAGVKVQLVTCFVTGRGSCPRFGFKFNFGSFPLRYVPTLGLPVLFGFRHGIMVYGYCL